MTLFIDACVRRESRTRRLAECLLSKWKEYNLEVVRLEEIRFPAVDEEFLSRRDSLIDAGEFGDPMFSFARQFAAADRIVVAAPYWDLSFPAMLKQYLEQVTVRGITFVYSPEGFPKGLCRAGELYYVTTAGGDYVPEEYGFGYVKAVAQGYFDIRDVRLIMAKGLDIAGADAEKILRESMGKLSEE